MEITRSHVGIETQNVVLTTPIES